MIFLRAILIVACACSFAGCDDWDDDDFHCHDGFCHEHDDHHHGSHLLGDGEGEVVVALTDRPHGKLRHFHVTVTGVALHSEEVGRQVLYENDAGFRVDLLSLRGSEETRLYELLTGAITVPAGTYDGFTLSLTEPSLTLASGTVIEAGIMDFHGEVRVDLNAPLPLAPEDIVYLLLDVDVLRSVSAPGTASERWRVRPLVVASVQREQLEIATPVDLNGVVTAVYPDEGIVELDLSARRGRLEVAAGDVTVTHAEQTLEFRQIVPGDVARVRGRLLGGEPFRARRVLLGEDSAPLPERSRATLEPALPSERQVGIVTAVDGMQVRVRTPAGTRGLMVLRETPIYQVEREQGGLHQEPVTPRAIQVGMSLEFEPGPAAGVPRLIVISSDPTLVRAGS